MGRTEMKILIGLHRNVNALDKKTSKIAAEYNLTFSQFMVLEALYSKGDMSVGEVRERILSSVGTIPLIVNNLVKMNYVERMCNEKDRRVCILHLTQEGYDVISKIVPRNEAMIAESMEVLDQEEKEKLLKQYHPDYKTSEFAVLKVGANSGEEVPHELCEMLQAHSRINPCEIDLEKIDYDVDAVSYTHLTLPTIA